MLSQEKQQQRCCAELFNYILVPEESRHLQLHLGIGELHPMRHGCI